MKIWVIGRHYPSKINRMRGSFEIAQAKMLARGGHDVTYIAVVFHPYKKIRNWGFATWFEDGIRVCGYSCPFFPEKMKIQLNKFRAVILRTALKRVEKETGLPEIIHVHYPAMITDPDVVLNYQKQGCAIVCTEHWTSVLAKTINTREKRQLLKYTNASDEFICVGEPLKRSIIELTRDREILIVPNIVEDNFSPVPKPSIVNKISFEFITVGRLVTVKQLDKIIDAFSQLIRKYPDARLTIVGNGEEKEKLEAQTHQYSLEDSIQFTGTLSRNEVADRMAHADCLICYSSLETFGVPVIEAWAAGIPAIASDAIGFAEYWQDGLGYIVDHRRVEDLVEKMKRVIEEKNEYDPSFLHNFAMEHFSETTVRSKLEEVYSKAISKANHDML